MSLNALYATSLSNAADTPVGTGWWLLFGLLMSVLVGLDLLALHRRAREPSMAESALTVAVWCLLALGFNALVWRMLGGKAGLQFTTGYLLEWSMSMDNVFVFAVIFRFFQVPKEHQYRILFWGILGAVVMRLAFILAGTAMIARFQFVMPLFGLFLIYTSYRLTRQSSAKVDPSRTIVFRLARRWLVEGKEQGAGSKEQGAGSREQEAGSREQEAGSREQEAKSGEQGAGSGEQRVGGMEQDVLLPAPSRGTCVPAGRLPAYTGRFLVRERGRLRITPLLLVLLIVESTDLLFAVDSIPAIFGITTNAFIVFTSNVFAILGLRALYFLLAGVMETFRYLHYGLAAVLAFVGLKMVAEGWLPHAAGKELLPPWVSLAVIAALLGAAIVASVSVKKEIAK